ncbi:hypothetical protein D9M72_441170 [compost metagenome]
MLVCRRVIDRVRAPGAHYFTQPRRIAYRGEQWDDTYVRRQLLQLLVDAIERVFAQLYEQQRGRRQLNDLPAQLTANGATGPRDQHHLTTDVLVQQVGYRLDRIPPQQIFDVDFNQIIDLHLAVGQIEQPREHPYMQMQWQQLVQNFHAAPAASRRHR